MSAAVSTKPGTQQEEALPKMVDLPSELFSQISFDCRGFQDSCEAGTTSVAGNEALPAENTATVQRTPLHVAQEMVASYNFDKKTGVSTFTIPAGVTDTEAMKAINEYFRQHLPGFKRDAIYSGDFAWYEKNLESRDASNAREITITAIVQGTAGENRTTQDGVLKDADLIFSDERDQAIAAALHACKHNGADLFEGKWARGSVPGFALDTDLYDGVYVLRYVDDGGFDRVAASGSPSPESK